MKIISLDKGCFAYILGLLLWCSHMHANYTRYNFSSLYWQSTVSGTVSDSAGPLPGVNIYVKGGASAAVSDENGNYSLYASIGDTLIFSFVGFKDTEVVVTAPVHNIILEEDATQLGEVVINAGYYNVRQQESTGSISRITSKDIETQPVANVLATMQGRMAGVNVIQETGVAGGGFSINIRGLNSLRSNGNNPLYIIDGVPYSSDPISNAQTSTSIPGDGNPLSSINPADIESLEILKDADATAIYGSRGANGVVLITTKKGKAGKGTFTINASHSIGNVTRFMDLMDTPQYLAMRRQAFANDGFTDYPANAYDVNGTWDQNRYTDWQKVLTGGTSHISSFQGTASGGSELTRYLISGNYRSETSVFPGDFRYKRGGARVNFDHTGDDRKFRVTFSGGYTVQHNDLPWTDFVRLSRQLAPNAPALYDAQGNLNWENSTWENPLSNLESKSLARTTDLIANAVLSYQITDGLQLKSSFGYTDLKNNDSRSIPSTMYDPAYQLGSQYSSIYFNDIARRSWIVEPQVNWNHSFGQAKMELLAGGTFQNQESNNMVTLASGFASNSLLYDLASASNVLITDNDKLVYRYQAFFGRVNFSYKDRYILNLTGRRDGSSRFGPGNRFATFGAAGVAWLFSREPLFEDLAFLSFGKLRASFGTTGNDQIGDYQYLDTYTSSGSQYGGINGLQPSRLYNGDFGWETNKKLEFALEAGFLNNRIFVTTAWYRNRSSSQLVGLPIPGTTGFTTMQDNLDATVQNTGFEASLRTVNWKTDNFEWATNFNLTVASNKLLAFPGLEYSAYRSDYVVGEPTTIRKLFHFTGVNPETGLYEFQDVDGDGAITYENDRETVVDFNPKYYGGIQNQFRYKGVHLEFLFQFVKQQNFNFANTQAYAGSFSNQPADYTQSWAQPGDAAAYQRYTTGADQQAVQAAEYFALSDGAVSDASYIRLKNIALSYDLPQKWTSGISCRLSLTAQNLLTITSFKGADPEFTQGSTLPPLRVVSFDVQLTF